MTELPPMTELPSETPAPAPDPLPYAVVAVALPLPRTYTYRIPEGLMEVLEPGHGVLVPFGPRLISAFVLERTTQLSIDPAKLKPIQRLLSPERLFPAELLPFFRWTADYYHHPIGEVIRTALPAGVLAESRACCVLLEPARQYLRGDASVKAPFPGRELQALLEPLLRQPLPWQKLLELDAVPQTAKKLRLLLDLGWLALEQRLQDASVRPQFEELYRPAVALSTRQLKGELQQMVLETLYSHGEATRETLAETLEGLGKKTSSLNAVLKRLLELELIEVETRETFRESLGGLEEALGPNVLTAAQAEAVQRITQALEGGRYQPFLLHGVTGSGKTEVYLSAVEQALARGLGAIVLVPEIGLTPQLVGRFRARFGSQIACLHSALSPGERYDGWRRLLRGDVKIAIGARSALFAPVKDLGLIVVDEEHDGSFKQDSGLRYHARDLAVVRAHQLGRVVVLGSATPSLESWANVKRQRFELLSLKARAREQALPTVHIIDMTKPEHRPRQADSPLSPPLEHALHQTLGGGKQAILLLNRRGYAPFVLCPGCGASFRCLSCDIALTYHRKKNLLLCHYCGMGKVLPERCPNCAHAPLELMGQGTERLEHFLSEQFPGVSVGRLDRDTVAGRGGHERVLDAFRRGEIQLLVGTQMVVKGHDFPNVTLVGILNADYALNLPDFRASERTFQLVTQVAGRAGRGESPGAVFVQTASSSHPSIRLAARHDAEGFFGIELRLRRAHDYPPFTRLALVQLSAREERQAEEQARVLTQFLRGQARTLAQEDAEKTVTVLGPAPAPLTRLQAWYRWQILLRAPTIGPIHALLRRVEHLPELNPSAEDLRISLDIDPQQLL